MNVEERLSFPFASTVEGANVGVFERDFCLLKPVTGSALMTKLMHVIGSLIRQMTRESGHNTFSLLFLKEGRVLQLTLLGYQFQ
jgi:hypothetical protein